MIHTLCNHSFVVLYRNLASRVTRSINLKVLFLTETFDIQLIAPSVLLITRIQPRPTSQCPLPHQTGLLDHISTPSRWTPRCVAGHYSISATATAGHCSISAMVVPRFVLSNPSTQPGTSGQGVITNPSSSVTHWLPL